MSIILPGALFFIISAITGLCIAGWKGLIVGWLLSIAVNFIILVAPIILVKDVRANGTLGWTLLLSLLSLLICIFSISYLPII